MVALTGLRRLLHRYTDVDSLTRIWRTNLQSSLRRCLYECPAEVESLTRIWRANLQSSLRRQVFVAVAVSTMSPEVTVALTLGRYLSAGAVRHTRRVPRWRASTQVWTTSLQSGLRRFPCDSAEVDSLTQVWTPACSRVSDGSLS